MNQAEQLLADSDRHSRKAALRSQEVLGHLTSHPGQTYLDVGCGNGLTTLYVAEQNQLRATGIDIDEEEVALAQQKSSGFTNVHFQMGNVESLPFPDASFDYVAFQFVMHHVPNRKTAFQELIRVTKPGGYILFSDLRLPLCSGFWKDRFKGKLRSFPKRQEMETLAKGASLTQIFSEARLTQYDIIWQKPSAAS